ncbi:MAG: hypothetical protein HY903_07245 [Deltaproteobacteria bacterium]|nr:hypothetical protein [Deltaproteobacteria bacterium]
MIPTPISAAAERRAERERFETELARRLLNLRVVTQSNLEAAIRQQVLTGGHLATNLWELGLADGRTLSRTSAEILDIREASPKALAKVPAKVRRLLALDVVERTRVLPMAVVRSVLRVATAEPWDHLALGEVARVSGYPLEPFFVAEVPLVRLMRRLYGIPLCPRFVPADKSIKTQRHRPGAAPPSADDGLWDELPELSADIATVVVSGEPQAGAPRRPPEGEALVPLTTLAAAREALAVAEDRDAIATVLLRFALSRGKRAALLLYRHGVWSGWHAAGHDVDPERVRQLSVPAQTATMFGLVASSGAPYLGPLAPHRWHIELWHALGEAVPGTVAFLPVHFRGKLVFGLYLDAGDGADMPTDVAEILVLAHSVPTAIERLIAHRIEASRRSG